jgi:predicted nucleic acid-binding protein
MIFIDTSAFYALFDRDDNHYNSAAQAWKAMREQPEQLACSNYILLETTALLQNRLGMPAVLDFAGLSNLLSVYWVDIELHKRAVATLLTAGRRGLSLVDCVSFEIMRTQGIRTAFTFDPHFTEQGFTCLPSTS